MAFGGGVFVTQNKKLPGAYINFVATPKVSTTLSDRGVVAIPYALKKAAGTVIEITKEQFIKESQTILGFEYTADGGKIFREIFKHANKCLIYDLGTENTSADAIAALEGYEFNVLAIYTEESTDVTAYVNAVKTWRDAGKKCQGVLYNATTNPDHEGIINVVSTVSDTNADAHALVAWVAGAEAGCAVNKTISNMVYDGEYTVVCDETQTQLEACLDAGEFVFHRDYGEVRVLEDINTLTTISDDKNEDFRYNQTIRVIDQIANDISKLFVTKYLGNIPNNEAGRASFWSDIVAHHRELETINAIEGFDSSLLTVEQGANRRSIVVNDAIQVVNTLSTLYMTVIVK